MSSDIKDRPTLDLDNRAELGFCGFFRALEKKSNSTIRIFERSSGDYYSVHGDDALYIARTVYKTSTVLKYLGGDINTGIPSCTMSRLVTESFLREALLVHQMRVEIWVTDTRKGGNAADWRLGRRASPGNLQELEEILFANTDLAVAPIVAAIQLTLQKGQKVIGAAFADTTERYIGVSEFVDNDLFSNLESLVIQLGIKECLVPISDLNKEYDLQKIHAVLKRCNVVISEIRRADFQTKNAEQDLNRLLDGEMSIVSRPEFEMTHAMGSAAGLIKYLSLLADDSNFGHYTLRKHDLAQYMRLDASAVRALNLMPSSQLGGNKSMSLFGLLDKCKTTQGSRLLRQWLKQPLMNLDQIRERQSLVGQFVDDTELLQTLHNDYLRSVPDLNRIAKKFQKNKAQLQDIVRVYQVVIKLPDLQESLQGATECPDLINKHYLTPLADCIGNLTKLQELVETMIDLTKVDYHQYQIKADFDPTLGELEVQMNEAYRQMMREQARVSDDLQMELDKRLKLEKNPIYGYCFRLTRIDAVCIRNQTSRYIELAVQRNGVHFTTPTLKQLSTDHSDAAQEYQRVQSTLVKEVMGIVNSYCPVFEQLNDLLAHLDVILSLAHTAVQAPIPYIRPDMTDIGDLRLTAARHPCLEVQDDVSFIPNDVTLIHNQMEFQVITGPNMSGKSTYIRQIGVIVLMAQVGSFVPCQEAQICLFDSVLARVGAGDNQLKGISTFMAEMLETSSILKTATERSLIIIDELGRGTSTHDGFGLAWAISEYILKNIRCFCLFATHFHELTALTDEFPQVGNLHVMAHVGEVDGRREITLLYKVKPGICDQSFGIHVAELANFPDSVVKLARRKAEELEDFAVAATDDTNHGNPKQPASRKADEVKSGSGAPPVTGMAAARFGPEEEQAGRAMVEQFMAEFSQTPNLKQLTPSEVRAAVKILRDKYHSDFQGNAYVQDILQAL
ncbi:MSH2 protein [Dimargaris cristalligena]|nr:MSH2 protein [Dimargaris cristalligena]